MIDYTGEGITHIHTGEMLNQLCSINKELKKIRSGLKTLAFVCVSLLCLKYKDVIKEKVNTVKGE